MGRSTAAGVRRVTRTFVSLVLTMTLLSSTCLLRAAPVYAKTSDSTTIALAVGGSILGIIIIAVIITVVVRTNPAWMPALPQGDTTAKSNPWARRDEGIHFGAGCGIRDGVVPLVCW